MILIAPHITAFLQQRLPVERHASGNTCDSYAYAFKLLFEYASHHLKTAPSDLYLEQIDAPLIMKFLNHLEATRHNGISSRNVRLAAIKSFMRYLEHRSRPRWIRSIVSGTLTRLGRLLVRIPSTSPLYESFFVMCS